MQDELSFGSGSPGGYDGVSSWRQERRQRLEKLARANGLPLGHPCRVELRGGITVEGVLELADEDLFLEASRNPKLELRIGRCTFVATEIVSAVRTD